MDFKEDSPQAFENNQRLDELIANAKNGCSTSLGELLNEYRPYLLQIANDQMPPQYRSKLGGSDIVQQSFLKAGTSFNQFKGKSAGELTSWLAKIVINSVLSARRYLRSEKRNADKEISMTREGSSEFNRFEIPSDGSSPSKRMISDECKSHIESAIASLPENYRRVILMRHQDGLSFSEIGFVLQRSDEASRKLWARAAEALAKQLRSMDMSE